MSLSEQSPVLYPNPFSAVLQTICRVLPRFLSRVLLRVISSPEAHQDPKPELSSPLSTAQIWQLYAPGLTVTSRLHITSMRTGDFKHSPYSCSHGESLQSLCHQSHPGNEWHSLLREQGHCRLD